MNEADSTIQDILSPTYIHHLGCVLFTPRPQLHTILHVLQSRILSSAQLLMQRMQQTGADELESKKVDLADSEAAMHSSECSFPANVIQYFPPLPSLYLLIAKLQHLLSSVQTQLEQRHAEQECDIPLISQEWFETWNRITDPYTQYASQSISTDFFDRGSWRASVKPQMEQNDDQAEQLSQHSPCTDWYTVEPDIVLEFIEVNLCDDNAEISPSSSSSSAIASSAASPSSTPHSRSTTTPMQIDQQHVSTNVTATPNTFNVPAAHAASASSFPVDALPVPMSTSHSSLLQPMHLPPAPILPTHVLSLADKVCIVGIQEFVVRLDAQSQDRAIKMLNRHLSWMQRGGVQSDTFQSFSKQMQQCTNANVTSLFNLLLHWKTVLNDIQFQLMLQLLDLSKFSDAQLYILCVLMLHCTDNMQADTQSLQSIQQFNVYHLSPSRIHLLLDAALSCRLIATSAKGFNNPAAHQASLGLYFLYMLEDCYIHGFISALLTTLLAPSPPPSTAPSPLLCQQYIEQAFLKADQFSRPHNVHNYEYIVVHVCSCYLYPYNKTQNVAFHYDIFPLLSQCLSVKSLHLLPPASMLSKLSANVPINVQWHEYVLPTPTTLSHSSKHIVYDDIGSRCGALILFLFMLLHQTKADTLSSSTVAGTLALYMQGILDQLSALSNDTNQYQPLVPILQQIASKCSARPAAFFNDKLKRIQQRIA